jgi:hypothetical protein
MHSPEKVAKATIKPACATGLLISINRSLSSGNLSLIRRFEKRGSGSSGVRVRFQRGTAAAKQERTALPTIAAIGCTSQYVAASDRRRADAKLPVQRKPGIAGRRRACHVVVTQDPFPPPVGWGGMHDLAQRRRKFWNGEGSLVRARSKSRARNHRSSLKLLRLR